MNVESITHYLYIALGGALGSVLRVYFGSFLPSFAIISVNIIGCFFMGVATELMGVYYPASYNLRLFIISGLLGGFTTFSAFTLEFGLLWQKNMISLALIYSIASVVLSILAFFVGLKMVKLWF